jgi:HEAT repeat protein/DNA-binding MarR family transcriptional regulator
MSSALRVFRPHRTPPEQLEKTFVAREPLLQEFLAKLEKWQPGKSRQHYLIIGPRGIGKTNLIRLLEYRIGQNPRLNGRWHPLSLSEDAYGITKVTDLLIEALRILDEKTKDPHIKSLYDRVKYDDDDRRVADLSLDAFRRFHAQHRCGILLMVENVNRVFENQFKYREEIHLLRKILIEEDWLMLICTSPTYLNAVTRPEEPLFEFFQVILLEELSPDGQREMLRKIALLENNIDFVESYLNKLRPQLQALYHFTGGNPRLTIMLYDLIAHQHLIDVRTELDSLLDKLTPFYQDRMKEIADQEAKLLEKMALMPEGCTPTELAREARMSAQNVRALLTRLERTGYVRREPRRRKRTVYIIPERFFRIWHQMNHSRSARGQIQYLIEFFTSWYATPTERDHVWEELSERLQTVLEEKQEERIDELSEFMEYIEEISEGEEKYKRLFDRLFKIHCYQGFNTIKNEMERYDNEYQNDGQYFLSKGVFLSKKIKKYGEALIAFRKANKLIPYNIKILFDLGLLLYHLKQNTEAEYNFTKITKLLRKEKGFGLHIKTEDMLLEVFQTEEDMDILSTTAHLLRRYSSDTATDKLITILQFSKSPLKRQLGVNSLGFIGSGKTILPLLDFLKDEAKNVRSSAATALGRIGSEFAIQPLIECLKDEANNVRGSAVAALGQIGSELTVQPLIECLKDEANNVRGNAVAALGRIGSELVVQPLIECLKDEANNVRGNAVAALGRIGSEFAIQPLIECLKDEANNVRDSAVTALTRIDPALLVQPLIKCLKDEANDVRGSAATALGRIGSELAVQPLIDCLKDEANDVRGSAATALGRIGSELAVQPLIECLKGEAKNVRGSAAMALGQIGSELAVQPLIEQLKNEDNTVRGSTATILGRIGSELAVQPLIECLKDEANNVRGSAATALGRIGSELAVQPLIECLKGEAKNVRGSAATALGRIGSELAVQPLIECLNDKANNVRGSAATALGQIGSELAVRSLIQCLKDEANDVRGSAVAALGRIGSALAVGPLVECLRDGAKNVRISAIIALGKVAHDRSIQDLDKVVQGLVEIIRYDVFYLCVKAVRNLLDSAFLWGNIETIGRAVDGAVNGFENGGEIFGPYVVALKYLKARRDPALMERQQPEMREAVQLLVDAFDQE